MTPSPRRILITGASSGLGAALARHYARPGNALLLLARNMQRLEAVAGACRDAGAEVVTCSVDVRDSTALAALVAQADAQAPIDTVFANAGIEASMGLAGQAESLEDAVAQIRTNFEGAIATVLPLVDPMRARRHGRIVLIASLAGRMPLPDQPTYSATKAGLIAFGSALRPILAAQGVRLTVACPGFIATGMGEGYRGPRPFEWSAERAAARIAAATERGSLGVAFPWPLVVLIGLGKLAPAVARDAFLRVFFKAHIATTTGRDADG